MNTKRIVSALTAVLALAAATPAIAINAGDVMDKMEPRERVGFIGGAADMASHLYAVAGNRTKADCITQWLFDRDNSLREIYDLFGAHKDRDAVGLLAILINRRCGE